MYCHRHRTPIIYQNLKELEISTNNKVFNIVEEFTRPRKNGPKNLKKLKALHQIPEVETKHVDFHLRKEQVWRYHWAWKDIKSAAAVAALS